MSTPLAKNFTANAVRALPDHGNRNETVHGELMMTSAPRGLHQRVFLVLGKADIKSLHLMIEIVSPSSARADRTTKRRLYQEQRIPVYCVVDIDERQVEVWTPDATFPAVERERVVWRHPLGVRDRPG